MYCFAVTRMEAVNRMIKVAWAFNFKHLIQSKHLFNEGLFENFSQYGGEGRATSVGVEGQHKLR